MLKTIGGLLLAGLIVFLVFGRPVCGCSSRTPGFFAELRSDIKWLTGAQETYYAEHGTYAQDFETLDGLIPDGRVTVEIIYAGSDGWAARASHWWFEEGPGQYRGADCVAGSGAGMTLVGTTLRGRSPTSDQPFVCDLDGWRSGQSAWERWRWQNSK